MRQDLRGPPWVRTLLEMVAALPGLVSDRLQLLALELHRAGRSLVQITALVLVAAILCTTAWLALCSGLGLALAWAAVWRVRRLLVNLGLPATRCHLVFGAAAATTDGAPRHHQPFTGRSEGTP